MPFYDYYCPQNDFTVEVYHSMKTRCRSWGEVCGLAGCDIGDTPQDAPVVRLVSDVKPSVFRLKGLDKDQPTDKLEL